jgi:hypothetical protein
MNYFRVITFLAASLMGSSLMADQWDKKTDITIDQAIDIQGTVLPAGSYVMKLLSSSMDRRVIYIFNADQKQLIASVIASSAYRLYPGDGEFKFYPVADGRTPALHKWFYPGENFGFEFRAVQEGVTIHVSRRHKNNANSNAGGD